MTDTTTSDGQLRVSEVWEETAEAQRHGLRRRAGRGQGVLAQVVFLALFFGAWEAFVALAGIRPYLLPRPSAIVAKTIDSFGLLVDHMWTTLFESIAGFLVAAIVGVAISVLIVSVPILKGVVMPALVGFNAVPKVAFAPLLIIWLGLGIESKVALSFLIAFFPIVVNTTTGMSEVEPEVLNLARLMKASRWQQFTKIRIPHALPAMFDGFRIALPIAIIGAIVAEFVASSKGLGYLILSAGVQLNTELVFASILMIVIFSMVLYALLVRLENRVLTWRPSAR